MPFMRRAAARWLDALAILVVLYALFHFFVAPLVVHEAAVPAAPVSLAALGGGRFVLAAQRGRVVFLDFWASWCGPCQLSLPLVERYARSHPDVVVIPVDVGENQATAAAFAREHGLTHVALDPDEIAAHAFGVSGFPTMVVVDPAGTVRAKWVGYDPAIEAAMAEATQRYRRAGRTGGGRWWRGAAAAATPATPVLVVEDDPNSLDTIRNTPFGWQLGPLTQGYLFLVDDRGRLVPDRALTVPTRHNGGISADGRTITYRLRTGRWSDGATFDARDVAFTVDALRNPRTTVPDTSAVADIAAYRVRDAATFEVRLRRPSAPFVDSFLSEGANDPFSILPRHIAAGYPSLDRSSLDTNPVGLGPFRLKRWLRGERLEFERNPFYWRGPARSPEIDVAVVPDATTRLLLARTGAVDVVEVAGLDLDAARTFPQLRLRATTTNIVDYLQLNLHSPQLRARSTRSAIARAIDRPRLAAAVYRSTLVPTDSVQSDPLYRTTQRLPPFDPAAARRLVAGRNIALDLAIASHWRNSSRAAVALAAQLAAVGIIVKIHGYGEAQFWGPRDAGGTLESARYDLALTSWSPALDPDRSYLFGCAAGPPGGGNSMFYCNRDYDRDEASGARIYDRTLRAPYYRDAGRRLLEDLPVIPLGFERRTYALNAGLRGFRPNVLGRDYWNAWEFALESPAPQ